MYTDIYIIMYLFVCALVYVCESGSWQCVWAAPV